MVRWLWKRIYSITTNTGSRLPALKSSPAGQFLLCSLLPTLLAIRLLFHPPCFVFSLEEQVGRPISAPLPAQTD
jgi:hypothetical protein